MQLAVVPDMGGGQAHALRFILLDGETSRLYRDHYAVRGRISVYTRGQGGRLGAADGRRRLGVAQARVVELGLDLPHALQCECATKKQTAG